MYIIYYAIWSNSPDGAIFYRICSQKKGKLTTADLWSKTEVFALDKIKTISKPSSRLTVCIATSGRCEVTIVMFEEPFFIDSQA